MDYRLRKIDELTIDLHSRLNLEVDSCYYLMEYCSGENYAFSEANDLILNFKKGLDKSHLAEFRYKAVAMRKIANLFRSQFTQTLLKNWTFVPIPPSKCRNHDHYDARMTQLLQLICHGYESHIRETIYMAEDMESSHETDFRPTVHQIYRNLRIDEDFRNPTPRKIILFDDVLTAGTHFKACKRLLEETYPDIEEIRGVFIARRIFPPSEEEDDGDDELW